MPVFDSTCGADATAYVAALLGCEPVSLRLWPGRGGEPFRDTDAVVPGARLRANLHAGPGGVHAVAGRRKYRSAGGLLHILHAAAESAACCCTVALHAPAAPAAGGSSERTCRPAPLACSITGPGRLEIVVSTLTGKTVTVYATPDSTAEQLKQAVSDLEGALVV